MGNNVVTLGIGGRQVNVGKLIAEGGFAFIYEADAGGEKYILKRMRVPKNHRELKAIAQHEQEVCQALKPHRHVVAVLGTQVMDIGRDWDFYILMEACRCSVADEVQRFYERKEFLPERTVLLVLRDVVLGLEHLHERDPPLAHRDIKVENVLVAPDGTYKLCDFGSSTAVHHAARETSQVPLIAEEISRNTTLAYRAPEQVDLYRQAPVSEKVDIWAVGCMVYKLCYFRTPFEDTQGNVEKIGILNGFDALRLPPPYLPRVGFAASPPYGGALVDLMKFCMNQSPDARPAAGLLLDVLDTWAADGRLPFWERPPPAVRAQRNASGAAPLQSLGPVSPGTAGTAGHDLEVSSGGRRRSTSDQDRMVPAAVSGGGPMRSESPILSPTSGALFRGTSKRRSTPTPPGSHSSLAAARARSTEHLGHLRQAELRRARTDGRAPGEWGNERRQSFVSETMKTGVLGLLGGDKERQRWIIKATSVRPGAPKAKYIRRIIIAIWEDELPLPVLFTFLGLRPLRSHEIVAVKGLVLLLKIVQNGPSTMLTQMASLLPNIDALGRHWAPRTQGSLGAAPSQPGPVAAPGMATFDRSRVPMPTMAAPMHGNAVDGRAEAAGAGAGAAPVTDHVQHGFLSGFPTPRSVRLDETGRPMHVLIAKVSQVLARKLAIHDENPEFSSHFTDATPGTRRAVPLLPPDHARTVIATMLDLETRLASVMVTALAVSADRREEAASKTAASLLLPLAEESFTLLSAIHNLLAVEVLLERADPKLDALLAHFRTEFDALRGLYARVAAHPEVRIFGRAPVLVDCIPVDDPAELGQYYVAVAPPSPYASLAGQRPPAPPLLAADPMDTVGAVCIPLAPQARDIFLARGCSLRFRPPTDGPQTPRPESPRSRKALAKTLASRGLADRQEASKCGDDDDDEEEDETPPTTQPNSGFFGNFADFPGGVPGTEPRPPDFGDLYAAGNGWEAEAITMDNSGRGAIGAAGEARPAAGSPFLVGFSSDHQLITEHTFTSHDVFFEGHRHPSARGGAFDPFGDPQKSGEALPWSPLPSSAFKAFSGEGGSAASSKAARDGAAGASMPPMFGSAGDHLRQPSGIPPSQDGSDDEDDAASPPDTPETAVEVMAGHARAPSGKLVDLGDLLGNDFDTPPDTTPRPSPPVDALLAETEKSAGFAAETSLPPMTPAQAVEDANPFDTDFAEHPIGGDAVAFGTGEARPEEEPQDDQRNAEAMHAWVESMDPAEQERLAQIWGAARQAWRSTMTPEVIKALDHCVASFEALNCVMPFTNLRVTDVVGTGAFATVYRAHMRLPPSRPGAPPGATVVAFKKLGTDNLQTMQVKTLADFESEVDLLRRLNHLNIVRFIGTTVDPLGVITELCSRGNLMVLLHNEHVALNWARKLAIVADTARGMQYLHAQVPPILHRDLKSLNILIDEHWNTKVTDFGLSRFKADSVAGNMTGQTGTYHWMAPEVINAEKYDERADVYSFGIILWETYGRAIPYEGMSPVQIVAAVVARRERLPILPGTPAAYATLIERCWAHDATERPRFNEVLAIIEEMQQRHEKSHKLRDQGS